MFKLSVISPIYNVENFLNEFLDSLKIQTLKSSEFEIILVDDGSTDRSSILIEDFSKQRSNVSTYFFEKSSGSAGRARNKGFEMAKGEYVMFLDPDDVLPDYSLEYLLNFIEQTGVSFAGSQFSKLIDGKITLYPSFFYSNNTVNRNIKNGDKTFLKLPPSVWSKIYRKDFLKSNNIRFLEGVIAQDFSFNFEATLKATSMAFLPVVTNYYRIRTSAEGSVTSRVTPTYFKDLLETRIFTTKLSVKDYAPLIDADVRFAVKQFTKVEISNYLKARKELRKYLNFLFKTSKDQGVILSTKSNLVRTPLAIDILWFFLKIKKLKSLIKGALK